jgi:site-specific DNA recombinase
MNRLPAVIYAAKSTEDHRGSIATQIQDCRDLAERSGWVVAGEFHDEGFSAYRGNRGPGLERAKQRAVRAAKESGQCMLVVQHSDRLARGAGDAPGAADHLGEVYFWARRHGVRLRSVQDDANLEDALRAVLIGERNTEDSARKSMATRAGKRRRFDRGDSAGPLPFGYSLVDATDNEGRVVTVGDRVLRRRVPEPTEAAVVVRMFGLLDDGHGIGDITRWLNEQGTRTKRGKPFTRNRVRDILQNPWYAGLVRIRRTELGPIGEPVGSWEVVGGNHEPLLSVTEFERITAKLARTDPASVARRKGGRPSDVALLSGVLFCGDCGHGIWHRKTGAGRNYRCSHARQKTGVCSAPRFEAQAVEEAVVDHLQSLFVDFAGWLEDVAGERAAQRDALVQRLAALHDDRARLARDRELVREDYMRQLRAGNARAADLATGELDRIAQEDATLGVEAADLEARLTEWDQPEATDTMLDWWNEFSAAIRGEVGQAASVREANAALRERFAAIYATVNDRSVRLDFVLKDPAPNEPIVAARLWADDDSAPVAEGLISFIQSGPPPDRVMPKVSASPR